MKKVISGIVAMTTVICALTGCGKDAADKAEETTTAETTEITEEVTSQAETEATEPTTEKESEKSQDSGSEEDTVRKIAEEFAETYNARDYIKLFRMSSEDNWNGMVEVYERDPELKAEGKDAYEISKILFENTCGKYDDDYKISTIKTITEADYRDTYYVRIDHNIGELMQEYIVEHGGAEKVDVKEFREMWERVPRNEFSEEVEKIKAYRITFDYTKGSESGIGDMLIYSINDGDWTIGELNFKEDRHEEYAELADYLKEYGGYELISEFRESDLYYDDFENEWYIVSSDISKNYNVPEFIDDIEECVYYIDEYNYLNHKWFIVAKGDEVVYAAVCDEDNNLIYFTDPGPNSVISIKSDGEYEFVDAAEVSASTFDDVYDACVKALKNK